MRSRGVGGSLVVRLSPLTCRWSVASSRGECLLLVRRPGVDRCERIAERVPLVRLVVKRLLPQFEREQAPKVAAERALPLDQLADVEVVGEVGPISGLLAGERIQHEIAELVV